MGRDGDGYELDVEIVSDPREAARAAGLRYVDEQEPGIVRKRWGRGFTYIDPDGNHIQDREERERLEALAIPPAWTDVWICADGNGHILATGRDDKGRKQYIYHPRWVDVRRRSKFNRIILFAQALPGIRERVDADLRRHGLPRERVLAIVVSLLDETLIRIGNDEYAASNNSYGLTTLRDRHVSTVNSNRVEFRFTGKSGKEHVVGLTDRRLARLVKRCRDVPGYELFQYYDDDGNRRAVDSGEVNQYLREIGGEDFTAKDFRTWGGTVLALRSLLDAGLPESQSEAQRQIVSCVRAVAAELGNTPAVCREYYIHPAVLECYERGELPGIVERHLQAGPAGSEWLSPAERATLALLVECASEPDR